MKQVANILSSVLRRLGSLCGMGYMCLLMVVLTVSALSSCSADSASEEAEEQQVAISFGNAQLGATEISQKDIQSNTGLENYSESFKVYGYKTVNNALQTVINNYTVNWQNHTAYTTSSNTNDWEYVGQGSGTQTIKFWDFSASKYRFFGYVPCRSTTQYSYTTNVTSDATSQTFTFGNLQYLTSDVNSTDFYKEGKYDTNDAGYKVTAAELPYYSKMWCQAPNAGSPVTLEFLKPFAQIRVMFTRIDGTTACALTNVKFAPVDGSDIRTTGTVAVKYDLTANAEQVTTTTDDAQTQLKQLTFKDQAETFWPSVNTQYQIAPVYYMLPNTSQGAYQLSADIAGIAKTCTVPAAYMQWNPNYQYTYVFKVTETDVMLVKVVQVAITQWSTSATTHEVYNW